MNTIDEIKANVGGLRNTGGIPLPVAVGIDLLTVAVGVWLFGFDSVWITALGVLVAFVGVFGLAEKVLRRVL